MSQYTLCAITLAGPARRQILLTSHLRFSPDLVVASKHFWTWSYIWTNICTSGMLVLMQQMGIKLDPHIKLDKMLILFPCFLDKITIFRGGTKKSAWKLNKEVNLHYPHLLSSCLACPSPSSQLLVWQRFFSIFTTDFALRFKNITGITFFKLNCIL